MDNGFSWSPPLVRCTTRQPQKPNSNSKCIKPKWKKCNKSPHSTLSIISHFEYAHRLCLFSFIVPSFNSPLYRLFVCFPLEKMIQSAPIPKHVTYIMDGNRRFAREKSQKLVDGYDKGADSLLAVGSKLVQFANRSGATLVNPLLFALSIDAYSYFTSSARLTWKSCLCTLFR